MQIENAEINEASLANKMRQMETGVRGKVRLGGGRGEGGERAVRFSPPALQNVLCVLLLHIFILHEQLAI